MGDNSAEETVMPSEKAMKASLQAYLDDNTASDLDGPVSLFADDFDDDGKITDLKAYIGPSDFVRA